MFWGWLLYFLLSMVGNRGCNGRKFANVCTLLIAIVYVLLLHLVFILSSFDCPSLFLGFYLLYLLINICFFFLVTHWCWKENGVRLWITKRCHRVGKCRLQTPDGRVFCNYQKIEQFIYEAFWAGGVKQPLNPPEPSSVPSSI